jgi:dipeptidyl aminopeptidase/acylaminoacyl peptidase
MPFLVAILAMQFDTGAKKLPEAITSETYALPPDEIKDYFDQPRYLNYTLGNLSPSRQWFARTKSNGGVRLSDIANPYENLAGLMLDTRANRARTMSYRISNSIILTSSADFQEREIKAPAGSWLSAGTWSPNGRYLMFMVHDEKESTVWIHDAEKNATRELVKNAILATRVTPEWISDSSGVLGVFVPKNRKPEPKAAAVPFQPKVQVSDAGKNKLRTFRASSLLSTELDQQRFEYFMTGQLAKVSVEGRMFEIGKPAMFSSIDSAPKGDFFRVTTVQRPFSYIVQASSFGSKEEIWDSAGKSLVNLSERKLQVGDSDTPPPTPGVPAAQPPVDPTLKRNLNWMPNGNGLVFVRTKPKSDATPTAPGEDEQGRGQRPSGLGGTPTTREPEELIQWVAPFRKEDEKVLLTRESGIPSFTWNQDGTAIYFSETKSGETSYKRLELGKDGKESVLYAYKGADTPGTIIATPNAFGVSTINDTAKYHLLRGVTTSQDEERSPSRSSLNLLDVATKKIAQVWKSEEKAVESIDGILNEQGSRLVISRQTATEIGQNFLVENGKRGKQLTSNKDYSPDLTEAKRYRFQVTRADGFKFWVKVTAPKWHVEGMKLPAFFWFYPNEVESQDAYNRGVRNPNPNLFPNQGGSPKTLLLRRGWALVEPDCPIVGPRNRVNDFYVNDLRNNLSAVIDALDTRGIADRTKLAIGGHSYGGFSTANAMVHTPFFKAGIAGAGNYNRTLTPISFQGEQRTVFEARSTYLDMSPILYAENMTGALLMYAGMDDQNVGTDPINTVRMFNVLESIGKPASLYMYPYEDHGQVAKETLMDQWARWIAWLDKYVLGEPSKDKSK